MADLTIQTSQPKSRINTALAAGMGAAVGSAARYIVPTKQELKPIQNSFDVFTSTTARAARANNRSILKYGAVGALIAGGISLVAKALKKDNNTENNSETTYSKYQAILDTSDYACMVSWWGD